jgi:type IV pilus assembly protein PilW
MNNNGQKGFSLVELMVALLLGLIISGAALNLFIGSRQTFNAISAEAQIQDSARFASEFLGRNLRIAGYRAFSQDNALASLPISAPFTSTDQVLIGYDHALGDTLIVRSGADAGIDCAGSNILNPTRMIFSVANNILRCTASNPDNPNNDGNGNVIVLLVNNIENMQLLYGEDTTGDERPNQYLNATNVANWDRVVSINIGLLVAAPFVTAPGLNQTYPLLDLNITGNDGQQRQVFESTFTLRNTLEVN